MFAVQKSVHCFGLLWLLLMPLWAMLSGAVRSGWFFVAVVDIELSGLEVCYHGGSAYSSFVSFRLAVSSHSCSVPVSACKNAKKLARSEKLCRSCVPGASNDASHSVFPAERQRRIR